VSARARWSWVLAALWLLAACSEDPAKLTQIVVVIDSDLSVPEELDAVQIEVSGRGLPIPARGAARAGAARPEAGAPG
jgi:hypothetical protein